MPKVPCFECFPKAMAGVAMALMLPSCQHTRSDFEPVNTVAEPAATEALTVPRDFLQTEDEALRRWLDERFDVEYRNMTPDLIFDQPPINQIKFEQGRMPEAPRLFHLKDPSLSRRQILHHIAEYWDLDMRIVSDATGRPSHVAVSAR